LSSLLSEFAVSPSGFAAHLSEVTSYKIHTLVTILKALVLPSTCALFC
jgi:hypothetical protein